MRELFSVKEVFRPKSLTTLALLLALRAILGLPFLTIYISGVKVFTLAHIIDAVCGMTFGPVAGLLFGFAGDFLGFVASQGSGGAYLPFYAFSEMATCLLFALFLYKREVTWPRVILPAVLNLLIVFLGLNTLWLWMLYGKETVMATLLARVSLNTAMTPVYVFLWYVVLKRFKMLYEKIGKRE
ncbi:MAG: folate family ECF transporter S component [Clostridiales Family XIII bacterium]|jgi:ECF transporter S component (folate family)|nr:folate family ECF transporter S component [Clostridiales Family XIII bacterium]